MPTPRLTATLHWDAAPSQGAETSTWGELAITLGDAVLWGVHDGERVRGIRWTWIDLLEHLAEVWPSLLHEEGWPEGPSITSPTTWATDTRAWLAALAPADAVTGEEELYEHRFRHDLAMAIRGKVLPPLWIVREGQCAWVGGETTSARLDVDDVELVLRSLGDQIAEQLEAVDDERAREAVRDWERALATEPSKPWTDGSETPSAMFA